MLVKCSMFGLVIIGRCFECKVATSSFKNWKTATLCWVDSCPGYTYTITALTTAPLRAGLGKAEENGWMDKLFMSFVTLMHIDIVTFLTYQLSTHEIYE